MQTVPASWNTIFNATHTTEYRFTIDGVNYEGSDLKDTPIISKPLLDKPALGRCCTGSVQVKVYPKREIPKAATVDAYCRLRSANGSTVTSWLPQGKYYVSTRSGKNPLQLNCLDRMIKAGIPYREKSAYTSWPVAMKTVVTEICRIMGVSLDSRTVIKTGPNYMVDYPNDDTLISEVLGMIAVAHGGSWIMTESGKLRLIVLASPGTAVQTLNKAHTGLTLRGKLQTISRVILVDSADNEFTAGNNNGITLSAKCDYATQVIADTLCSTSGVANDHGGLDIPGASKSSTGVLTVAKGNISNGNLNIISSSVLYGQTFQAYTLSGAYLNPAIELGDTISVTDREGTVHSIVAYSITMNCTTACTCSLSASVEGETEQEYPYQTMQELSLSRTVRTDQTYYGNRINRAEGFVSELLVNGGAQARMTANASIFSMQSVYNGNWIDRIYFDAITGKYVITGDVTVQGLATFKDSLAANGTTVINGGNITTGILKSHDGRLQIDLDRGTLTVNNTDVEKALAAADNEIEITSTSQMFTKAAGATTYTPNSITLTAQSVNNLVSYQWYKDNAILSGKTARTLTITASDISGNSATFKVIGRDADGNTYTDFLSVAKLSDGNDGTPGTPGTPGVDGYTAILSNEYIEIPVNVNRKPLTAATYSCVVSVYKGVTAMTATKNNTLAVGQFKVSPGTATGITVAQSTAGTITLTTNTTTAILDSAELPLTITIYGGYTVNTKIAIHANMNTVTVQQEASITTNATNIELRVRKDSVISSINQSAESITISASKVNLAGYVTFTNLSTSGQTEIDGGNIKTGTITATQIAASTITGAKIAAGTIEASNIKSNTITATQIASNTITAAQIASGAVNTDELAANAVTAAKIAAGTITATQIAASTITGSKIASQTIEASNIKSNTITATQIAANTITASQIASSTITATQLSSGAVTTDKLAANAVTAAKIAANTITASQIASSTITGSNIAANTITASNIKSSTITVDKLAAGVLSADNITTGTLNASKVTITNINASNITSGKLSADRIDVTNLDVSSAHIQYVYAYASSYKIVMKSVSSSTLYLGGDGTWNVSDVYLYASSKVQIGGYSAFSYGLTIDTSSKCLRSNSSGYQAWSLGSSTYPFSNLYVDSARLGKSGGSIGFFGTTPTSKKSVSKCSTLSSVSASTVATALNNLLTALAGYGLISSS